MTLNIIIIVFIGERYSWLFCSSILTRYQFIRRRLLDFFVLGNSEV